MSSASRYRCVNPSYASIPLHLPYSVKTTITFFICVFINAIISPLAAFQQFAVKLVPTTARRAEKPPAIGCSDSPAPPGGRRRRAPAAVVHLHRSTPPKAKGHRSLGHFVYMFFS